jgi:hypothetical protein
VVTGVCQPFYSLQSINDFISKYGSLLSALERIEEDNPIIPIEIQFRTDTLLLAKPLRQWFEKEKPLEY